MAQIYESKTAAHNRSILGFISIVNTCSYLTALKELIWFYLEEQLGLKCIRPAVLQLMGSSVVDLLDENFCNGVL